MFFMDIETFKNSFLYFVCSFYRIDNKVNYFDRAGDEGQLGYYTFSTT